MKSRFLLILGGALILASTLMAQDEAPFPPHPDNVGATATPHLRMSRANPYHPRHGLPHRRDNPAWLDSLSLPTDRTVYNSTNRACAENPRVDQDGRKREV
jgi:hypothetical protein